MDKNYWKDYYSKNEQNRKPSLFAKYIAKKYLNDKNIKLIELGCGNGRDSIYFGEQGINVLAIDQVGEEIDFLQKKFINVKNLEFKSDDFTNLESDQLFNVVYSRFTLHSINSTQQNRVLNWSYNQLKENGLFCIEVRGQKNELYKKGKKVEGEKDAYNYNNHYRRFLDFNTFCKQLEELGYTVEYSQESKGFAPFNDNDETFIRVIAKK